MPLFEVSHVFGCLLCLFIAGVKGKLVEDCIRKAVPVDAVWFPFTPGYEDMITLEPLHVKNSPLALAYARNDDDVVALLRCATEKGIRVTIRCGGHSNAGASTMDGALCIDISWMNKTTMKGNEATIQAGSTAGTAVYHVFMQSNGTRGVPVGEKPGVGFAGLILGGGFGFSSRRDGLLCDRLISLKAVTLWGEKIRISREEHADLFWASCGGGGGNFVAVTEFTIKTTDVSMGVVSYRCTPNATVDLVEFLDWYQAWAVDARHQMSPNIELSGAQMLIEGMFWGSLKEFEEMLHKTVNETAPMKISDFRSDGVAPCVVQEDFIHAAMALSGWAQREEPIEGLLERFPQYRAYYKFKTLMLYEPLPVDALRILHDSWDRSLYGFSFEFQPLGGNGSAVVAVDPYATAYVHRKAEFCLILYAYASAKEELDHFAATMRQVYHDISKSLKWRGAYINQLDTDLADETYEQLYFSVLGDGSSEPIVDGNRTLERLASVRQRYNPTGSLANIQPAGVYSSTASSSDVGHLSGDLSQPSTSLSFLFVAIVICLVVRW